jgi:hypothetical protein
MQPMRRQSDYPFANLLMYREMNIQRDYRQKVRRILLQSVLIAAAVVLLWQPLAYFLAR